MSERVPGKILLITSILIMPVLLLLYLFSLTYQEKLAEKICYQDEKITITSAGIIEKRGLHAVIPPNHRLLPYNPDYHGFITKVEYPVIHYPANRKIEKKINKKLQHLFKADKTTLQESFTSGLACHNRITFYAERIDEILAILADESYYTCGAAHSSTGFSIYHFHLATGEEIHPEEMIIQNEGFKNLVNHIIAQDPFYGFTSDAECHFADEIGGFMISPDGLNIFFAAYTGPAPGGGWLAFTIDYEKLKPFIKQGTILAYIAEKKSKGK
ncbi:hypothetical protein SAMN02745221_00300 [Thermosyntropha lipolytica DSM 11003]|uniref:DUF3298 domain-containing protein n=1 Tax=Thermosyntropha lipolytica DSM 11003 TaxID=1123382 RepID=A0A1M5K5T2_9FIRM|nr:hypothetical protein [Thermosyntropha lipolytica]SHG48146.1 hypothetical protein SAMN02745221_00300 [Thermosyntropha lipolytica DSM 11003]